MSGILRGGRIVKQVDSFDGDDLLAELGVEIPWPSQQKKAAKVECGDAAPGLRRHTEWSNAQSFVFAGYVARVVQTTCNCCGSMRENLNGVFTVEVKEGTGARRMQALSEKGDWPQHDQHTVEVEQAFTRFCPDCLRELGFSREVEAKDGPRDILIR